MNRGTAQPEAPRLALHWRALNAVLWCILVALLIAPFAVLGAFLNSGPVDMHGLLLNRLADLAGRDGTNIVELAALAGHPVDRVCTIPGYANVHRGAEDLGLDATGLPDSGPSTFDEHLVPVDSNGLFLISPSGDVTYGALPTEIFAPRTRSCITGSRLAFRFDGAALIPIRYGVTAPIADGVIIDLDAPSLQPRDAP